MDYCELDVRETAGLAEKMWTDIPDLRSAVLTRFNWTRFGITLGGATPQSGRITLDLSMTGTRSGLRRQVGTFRLYTNLMCSLRNGENGFLWLPSLELSSRSIMEGLRLIGT